MAAAGALALAACNPAPTDTGGSPSAAALPAEGTAELRVCFGANDPPRSLRADTAGFDIDVARFVAEALGRRLRIVWLPEQPQTDIESTDVDYRPLLAGECDAQLSVAGIEPVTRFRGRLALSAPYYGAAFELIPANADFRWGQPFAETVAVYSNSVAHVAIDAAGVSWTMQASTDDILHAVANGSAAAALVWGPDLAAFEIDWNEAFEPPPVLRWNLHAVARHDDPLLAELDRVFASAPFRAQVQSLQAEHRIPARAPFATVYSAERLMALRSRSQ